MTRYARLSARWPYPSVRPAVLDDMEDLVLLCRGLADEDHEILCWDEEEYRLRAEWEAEAQAEDLLDAQSAWEERRQAFEYTWYDAPEAP